MCRFVLRSASDFKIRNRKSKGELRSKSKMRGGQAHHLRPPAGQQHSSERLWSRRMRAEPGLPNAGTKTGRPPGGKQSGITGAFLRRSGKNQHPGQKGHGQSLQGACRKTENSALKARHAAVHVSRQEQSSGSRVLKRSAACGQET